MGFGTIASGPGVVRRMASVAELAVDPRTRGMLGPVGAGALPASISMRTTGEGVRIASVNIHMAVPADLGFDLANENISALRDVARFINGANPDVVLVQELRNRPVAAAVVQGGLGDTASLLGRFIDADDMAYTPAITQDPFTTPHEFYGTAIYARNGFTIEQAINARLPTSTPDVELRSVGIAAIRPPDDRTPFTVFGTHLANRVVEDQPLRNAQLGAIIELDEQVAAGGRVAYVDALGGSRELSSAPFPSTRRFLGGDLNQEQDVTDAVLRPAGWEHANDALARRGDRQSIDHARAASVNTSLVGAHRIDHPYEIGFEVRDSAVGAVQRHEFDGDATDHLGLVIDLA